MRRYLTIIFSIALVAGGIYFSGKIMNREKPQRPQKEKAVQMVFTEEVVNAEIPVIISESGRLVSKNRMAIYAEVQGVMESVYKDFKPGSIYKKGEIMVKITSTDFNANLQAQKSVLQNLITSIMPDLRLDYPEAYPKWDQYLRQFDVQKALKPLPETGSDKEKFFITGKNIYTTYYNTKNLEIVLLKYTLRAPFDGILTEALVNPGTVVRPGQKLGEFIDLGVFELEVAVSNIVLPALVIGEKVEVQDPQDADKSWMGTISRINGRVNSTTQTVQVFIELAAKDLREGMYLNAKMVGKPIKEAFEVSRTLIFNENKLYAVQDSALQIVEVELVHKFDRSVIVKGLENGMQILTKPVPGAFGGMQVVINQAE